MLGYESSESREGELVGLIPREEGAVGGASGVVAAGTDAGVVPRTADACAARVFSACEWESAVQHWSCDTVGLFGRFSSDCNADSTFTQF